MNPGDKPVMAGLSSHIDQKRDSKRQLNHHIHVNLKDFQSPPTSSNHAHDELEVYLSLYSPKTSSYISERVLLTSTKSGNTWSASSSHTNNKNNRENAKNSINNNNTNGAIFMDVGTLDQCRELHLVCHVIRIGKMTSNQGSSLSTNPITVISGSGGMDGKKSTSSFFQNNNVTCRRPCSVASVNINKLVTRS